MQVIFLSHQRWLYGIMCLNSYMTECIYGIYQLPESL